MTNTKVSDVLSILMGGMSESSLARAVNLPKATIHRVLSGSTPDPRAGTLLPIAQYFNITIEQLMGVVDLPSNSPLRSSESLSAIEMPFVSFNNLRGWLKGEYEPDRFYEITSFSDKKLNSNCFITRIESDEMTPLFSQKTYLIIMKQTTANEDDMVLLIDSDHNIMIRKYISLKGEKYLISSNPSYEIISFEETMKLIGVVIEGRIII